MPKSIVKSSAQKTAASGQIRIISGQYRGRKLPVADAQGLRPTTDRIKETVFNWLNMDLPDSQCLDLFAGSGGLGLEAVSRFAAHVDACELSPKIAALLRDNAKRLSLDPKRYQVHQIDALAFLARPTTTLYDIVFIDPPFRQGLVSSSCELLNNHLQEKALIYIEHESDLKDWITPSTWTQLKTKTAGQVTFSLYQNVN
ncbi:16S rRNA (guanine(966)-N(2))-methyltransferase RsmD [Alginatibacterium sediminis]|uniref:Ribosomal RNA small subunit methyltransferase D n=2 Tax=Alginatibacterium sediminis TaxID=2164068 RepID=A0A420ELL3_9ALTE|nr:16S rRNA (guanine(966)-N(2))-methyltransferase RsmD [Alginatibacterium sediminis]RKF21573.1 16S rRNA (guanine(966)-N(2))-methyltransferase RsmD [Alginatibacterium sediminis]